MGEMWTVVTQGFTAILGLVAEFLTALIGGGLAPLLGLFGIGIAISLVMLSVRVVRKVTWGA